MMIPSSFHPDSSPGPNQPQLAEAALDILSASEAGEACARLTFHIKEFFPGIQVSILLADPEKDRLSLYMRDGNPVTDLVAASEALHQGIAGEVFRTGKVASRKIEDDLAEGQLALPLKSKEKVIGVVALAKPGEALLIEPSQESRIIALAALAAASIETTRLYREEQERGRVEAVIIEAERKLSSGLKPNELPAKILAELAVVVPYERGSLLLRDGVVLKIAAQHGFPPGERTQNLVIPLREGDVYKQIETTCLPVLIDDVTRESGWSQVEWLPLNLSWLGLPLFSTDRVVGMVSLTRRERSAFSRDDVLMATTFALQAAVALENARLYEEITRFNQQLEQMVQQRTEELRRALRKLERMDKNKGDFINKVAHELRTPLTIMKGYMQMMQGEPSVRSSPYLAQAADGLERGTERLHEIVNTMLDVVRIDNEVLDIKPEIMTVSTLTHRIQADFETFLEDRKLTLKLVGLEGLPLVLGDASLLLKVFQNVVLNAIKYTPDGGEITLSGRQVQDEQCGECVEILVQDKGIGIDSDYHELIFEKFYSTESLAHHSSGKTTFKGGGPGLGLAIARGILLAHKGRIWVESERHDEETYPGSCFHILLPVVPKG